MASPFRCSGNIIERMRKSKFNAKYNREVLILDGLYDFHPEAFDCLSAAELRILRTYYLLGEAVPEDVFSYRERVLEKNPDLEDASRIIANRVCVSLGIRDFLLGSLEVPRQDTSK